MISKELKETLIDWAEKYNDPVYFKEDPIAFPRHFAESKACQQDIEIAAVFAAHFAWGRRSMIVRDCERLFEHMEWHPYDYVRSGSYRCDESSIHRTIKWSDIARICQSLNDFYSQNNSLESLNTEQIREKIFKQKSDPKAPNKKINMMRRWLVRRDGKVDLGIWKQVYTASLIIPLDTHVYSQASNLGLSNRRSKDINTAIEITRAFDEVFPGDPVLGDFALFGYGVTHKTQES